METYRLVILAVSLAMPLFIVALKKFTFAFQNYKKRTLSCQEKLFLNNECYDYVTAGHMAEEEVMIKDNETGMVYDDYELEQL